MRNKVFSTFAEAIADVADGVTIMVGGFGVAADIPFNLIRSLAEHGARDLTIISNTPGTGGKLAQKWWGIPQWTDCNLLVENRQVRKFISSITFAGTASEKAILGGDVEIEFVPQGTLAERVRAGAFGIGGFYTRTGIGTMVAQGKRMETINGEQFLLELPLRADFAFIKAKKADCYGNLTYRGNTRSFNAIMAAAARVTIAEVEDIVAVGELDSESIVTSEVFVDRVVEIPH